MIKNLFYAPESDAGCAAIAPAENESEKYLLQVKNLKNVFSIGKNLLKKNRSILKPLTEYRLTFRRERPSA